MNDPNGFIYFKGEYHLFFQYFPYAPVWGTMHWGHAVSKDLIHWKHLGIALFPTLYEEQNGCFSGSALECDGKLYLYYTGVRYKKPDQNNIHVCTNDEYIATQFMITSEDGVHFDNFSDKKMIIPMIEDEEIGDLKDTRDPKVWREGNYIYMALGSTYRKETGRLLIYKSSDGKTWEYASQLRSEKFGKILECPDIFKINGTYIFIGSPMHIVAENAGMYEHHAVCMPIEFDTETCAIALPEWERCQYVDYGMDLYAPQTNIDAEGRRVMVAWIRMPKVVKEAGQTDWIGMMSLPRVIEQIDNHIYFRVHPSVEKYFNREVSAKDGKMPDCPCRIKTELKEDENLDVGGYKIWVEDGTVKTDRRKVFATIEGHHLTSETPKVGNFRLDIFVDKNLIEIFINEGEYVISNVVYGLGNRIIGPVENIFCGEIS